MTDVFKCHSGNMTVSDDRFSGLKVYIFEVQQGRVGGTTFTTGPCVPTILCAAVLYTHLVVEWK